MEQQSRDQGTTTNSANQTNEKRRLHSCDSCDSWLKAFGLPTKPDGVMGCEIWVKVGDPVPAGSNDVQFLGLDSASPYVAEYDGSKGGQKAHYMLRWVTTRGDKGPWNETVSATIAG
jgi:hypothetical protein